MKEEEMSKETIEQSQAKRRARRKLLRMGNRGQASYFMARKWLWWGKSDYFRRGE